MELRGHATPRSLVNSFRLMSLRFNFRRTLSLSSLSLIKPAFDIHPPKSSNNNCLIKIVESSVILLRATSIIKDVKDKLGIRDSSWAGIVLNVRSGYDDSLAFAREM